MENGELLTIGAIVKNMSSGGGEVPETKYSTTEQKIGTWTDNKDVYELTIVSSEPIDMYVFTAIADLTANNIDEIISFNFTLTVNEDGDTIYRTYAPCGYIVPFFNKSDNKLYFKQTLTSRGGLSWKTIAVIRYIKKTN